MDQVVEFLIKFDLQNLIAIAVMFWFFNKHLEKKFDKIDQRFDKIDQRFDKTDLRFEKIDHRFEKIELTLHDLDKRLYRMEGSIISKECCMLKDDRQIKQAE